MLSGRLDEILKAAADPTRLRLLNLLRLGGICVCDLRAVLRIPHPTVSRRLEKLTSDDSPSRMLSLAKALA